MRRSLKVILFIAALLLLAVIPLARQFEKGAIQGVIADTHGPIPDASVDARNLASGVVIHAIADTAGEYTLENLRPGQYSLWIEAAGHDSLWIPRVIVESGLTSRQDIHLDQSRFGGAAGF